jgi:uncharacterized protein YdgA (DUF945 family)
MTLLIMLGVGVALIALITGIAWYFDMRHLNEIDDMGMDD